MTLGKALMSLAELYKHSVHSKHDIYSKLEKKNFFVNQFNYFKVWRRAVNYIIITTDVYVCKKKNIAFLPQYLTLFLL